MAEDSGRVYPLSDQANSVLDVLRFAAEQAGVQTVCGFDAQSVRKKARGYQLTAADGAGYFADRLIIACGGCAGKALGGTMAGYDLLGQLGHSRTPLHPSLTQIRTDPAPIRGLKGVRADCHIRLRAGGRTVQEDAGEAQFTETGVSGPAAFTPLAAGGTGAGGGAAARPAAGLSRAAGPGAARRAESCPPAAAGRGRAGRDAPSAAGKDALPRLRARAAAAGRGPGRSAGRAGEEDQNFALPVTGVSGFESAQVTAGGVRTAEFRADTLESRLAPGVFACGEVLDIDGDCGGYNLQWAWSSGYVAGMLGKQEEPR